MRSRIVVLISGSGTNQQALIDDLAGADAPAEIVAVISNKAEAYGLVRASNAGIQTRALDHREFADRAAFDRALIAEIDAFQPDLVLLAGFMRILTADFVTHYRGRLLNIHPSLLPRHKGLQTHQRALDAGDEEHGASIHFVTEELDGGPVVIQGRVTVHPDDDAASLTSRVQVKEHALYPLAARWFATGRLRLEGDQACLDGTPIPPSGLRLEDIESGR